MSDKKAKGKKKKRGRNALTFYEKIAVIRHHEANQMSRNSLARMFQCCTTQIRRILERKDELLIQWQSMSEADASVIVDEMARKKREFEIKAVEFILHQWVERCRHLQLNIVINNEMLKIVALKMAAVLNLQEFRPTPRWVEKFRLKFKYKGTNLAKPRTTKDPQETLSVEDIIIEYKHYLPSFMQQEITNITWNNLRGSGFPGEKSTEEEIVQERGIDAVANGADESSWSEHTDSTQVPGTNEVSVEDILQYLSVIQQFTLLNEDHWGMAMLKQIEDHIKKNYAVELETNQGDDDADDRDDDIIICGSEFSSVFE